VSRALQSDSGVCAGDLRDRCHLGGSQGLQVTGGDLLSTNRASPKQYPLIYPPCPPHSYCRPYTVESTNNLAELLQVGEGRPGAASVGAEARS
jgi:hypothetical protein